MNKENTNRFLRLNQVLDIIPVPKSSWYAGIARGEYPKPIKLSKRSAAWKASDIQALYNKLAEQS